MPDPFFRLAQPRSPKNADLTAEEAMALEDVGLIALQPSGRGSAKAFSAALPKAGGETPEEIALAYRAFLLSHDPADPRQLDSWCDSFKGEAEHARLFRDLHRSNPRAAYQLAEALTSLPEVGAEFLGFQLTAELGRGAFGRVYLARQGDLANRPVALKVSTDSFGESQTLAQLQHTNIVPIYSLHRAGPLQALCMPYFGSITLADVLRDLGRRDSLPLSGKGLVSTLRDRSSLKDERARDAAPSGSESSPTPPARQVTLKMLEGMTYVEAVLWIGSRLADGLAHAHERGILHRDLKPANILLADDGQPMLLDFNLSADRNPRNTGTASLIGGTLPYMSPEHLAAFRGDPCLVDARGDVYALGIILCELLTGHYPFGRFHGPLESVLPRMIEERFHCVPEVRPWNGAITPATEAIVLHCLLPDPARRYQSAAELRDDLERQLRHEPLRHSPEPSLLEQANKWRRRHPRLAPLALLALAAGLLILVTTLFVLRGRELARQSEETARLAALDTRNHFREELKTARLLLNGRDADRRQRQEGQVIGRRALDRYRVLDKPVWQDLPEFRRLPADEQDRLRTELGELLLLLAGSESFDVANRRAGGVSPPSKAPVADSSLGGLTPPARQELQVALRMNQLAETCFGDKPPRALWVQRAALAMRLEQKEEAQRLEKRAEKLPVRDPWEHYLLARERALQGRWRDALPLLREALAGNPQNFGAWFLLANCSMDGLGRDDEAVAHYTTCIALWPDFYGSYFNRGLAQLRRRDYAAAAADFTRTLQRRPDYAEGYIHRSLSLEAQGKYREALADLNRAIALDASSTRVYFMRARIEQRLGDRAGAKRDLQEGMRRRPADEESWIARGIARLNDDPDAALADFAKAVELNPRSLAGWENQAHVLAEKLGRTEEAIAKLDRVLEFYPEFVPARGGRGVLRARLGQRDAALRDARAALLRDTRAPTLYQVAGIYARIAPGHPEDRREALRLLASALQQGFGIDLIDTDNDLDPLRNDPQFRELVQAARALRAQKIR